MKKWLSNQSIIVKLVVTGGATILIIIVLSSTIMAYFFYKSYTANKIHTIANNIERQVFLARIAEKDFVKNDLINTEFHSSGTSDNLVDNRVHISKVRAEILDLIKLWSGAKERQAEELLKLSDQYRHLFSVSDSLQVLLLQQLSLIVARSSRNQNMKLYSCVIPW